MADLAPQLIAAIKGDKGLYPVNGGYVSSVAYRKDTVLRDNGSQWRALQLVPPATPPAEGAYWTKFIDGTPVADAAQVAADRVLSQAAAATASAAMDSVSANALLIGGYATAAQLSAQSAAAVSGLANLSAAARAITLDSGVTASYIYDTTLDDVPEWTASVTSSLTSEPLNGTTRGSKARHPKVMGIAALGVARQFVIYDLDDPAAPVWKAWSEVTGGPFNLNTVPQITAITAKNGIIEIAMSSAGKFAIDLVLDKAVWFRNAVTPNCGVYQGNLAEQGKGFPGTLPPWFDNPSLAILNGTINHVAMTIFPQMRPNPDRFGMRNPTCAYATAGGVGIIRPDGVAINSASISAFGRVAFDRNSNLYVTSTIGSSFLWFVDCPTYMSAAFPLQNLTSASVPATMNGSPTSPSVIRAVGDRIALGAGTVGLTLLSRHRGILTNSAVDYVDEFRNTGRQFSAAKLACAESSRLVATLQSNELLQNGKFDTDLSSWVSDDQGTGFAPSTWDLGRAKLERVSGTNRAGRAQTPTTVLFQMYCVTTVVSTAVGFVAVGATGFVAGVGTTKFYFRASSTSTVIALRARDDGTTTYFDEISVKAVATDYSAGGNHLEAVGTVNRTVVAVGAELAGYNMTTVGSYLKGQAGQLNFGTSDFYMSVWTVGANANQGIFHFTDYVGGTADGSNTGTYLVINGPGQMTFLVRDPVNGVVSAQTPVSTFNPAALNYTVACRRGNRLELWVNGALVQSVPVTATVTNLAAELLIGAMYYGGTIQLRFGTGIISLPRYGLGAPSPDQIRAAYRAEWDMHQPGAKCLLQGGSNVQDIGYDPDTDLIYVAKSVGGTDVFQGLVNKSTILSTTSINKFPNSGFAGTIIGGPGVGKFDRSVALPAIKDGVSLSITSAGPGIFALRINGTATATSGITWGLQSASTGSATAINPGETWISSIEFQLAAGSLTGITPILRFDRLNASNTTIGTSGATSLSPTGTFTRWATTVTAEATSVNGTTMFVVNYINGATIDATILFRQPQVEKSSNFSAFVSGLSGSDNHKGVSTHDGNVSIVTGNGVDVIMPALALRERLRARRSMAASDSNVSRFNGRITSDATPTFLGDPIYVPEGGKVDAIVSVTAAVPGGTATELLTTLLKVRANRDIGVSAATVFCSVISGTPPLPDKTTGTMDITVASMGGGWINVRATGKAATTIEWFGEQRLVRSAA
ncbi:MAG TPA: hypothetical protein VGU72_01195 [Beijerinckiaceae bacterium]|jgi:hypothetical protein|nr:hypothetical protein [Beijerinckiaceae bacterium]